MKMGLKRSLVSILNILLPSLIFYVFYQFIGLLYAIGLSAVYSIAILAFKWKKHKKIKSTQIIGMITSIMSGVMITFTNNANLYFVPALVNNTIIAVWIVVLAFQKKSILHYVAKDFELKNINNISEDSILGLNLIWLVYFLLKIVSKAIGILFLNFHVAYWIVFLLGDPAMIIMIAISVMYIKVKCKTA